MHVISDTYFGYVRNGHQIPLDLIIEPTYLFLNNNRELITQPITKFQLYEIYK